MSGPNIPKAWKDWFLQTRVARYPLATILVLLVALGSLFWLMPEFLYFLAGLFGRMPGPVPTPVP